MAKIKISKSKIYQYFIETDDNIRNWDMDLNFPKYTTQLMNLISNTAQATRSSVVGQMTDLIPEFLQLKEDHSISAWKKWYTERYLNSIENATDKIFSILKNYVAAIQQIDRAMIEKWVEDLVIYKSYTGIVIQGIALQMIAKKYNKSYRRATPEEESDGIDGYIGDVPVQIKPRNGESYNVLMDKYRTKYLLVTYKKEDKSVSIEFDESKIS
ncbi:MAG: MjaI family restriction endonuclease [Flavobacteriaceae bacterium]|nr:MjaI family restriction endonuclease [Flavobacteriaceae bacterium]